MGIVCWQCGDIGFHEALIYCNQCKITPRHRYCLEKIPEDLNGIVVWQCEDCRKSVFHPTKKLRSRGRKTRFLKTFSWPRLTKLRSKYSRKRSPCSDRNLRVTNRKSRFHKTVRCSGKSEAGLKDQCHDYTVDEDFVDSLPEWPTPASRIDLGLNTHGSDDLKRDTSSCSIGALGAVESPASVVNNQNASGLNVENGGCNNIQGKNPNYSIGASCVVESSTFLPVEEHEDYAKKEPNRRKLVLKSDIDFNDSNPSQDDQNIDIQVAANNATSLETPHLQVQQIETSLPIEFPCQLTQPVMHVNSPVWRGCFIICNDKLGPFGAHLSNRACEKVCKLARNFPLVLYMEKLARLDAWPNSFRKSPPTDNDVAIFFFPGSTRVEAVLDELVDDITNNDLVLRFQFHNVELLVFSSIVLPQEQQRICEKFFAWGVFKPRSAQISSLIPSSDNHPNRPGVIQVYEDINYANEKKADEVDITRLKQLKRTEKGNSSYTETSFEENRLRSYNRKPDVDVGSPVMEFSSREMKSFSLAGCSSSSKSCISELKEVARERLKVSRELEEGEIFDDEDTPTQLSDILAEMDGEVCEDVCSITLSVVALQDEINEIADRKQKSREWVKRSRDIKDVDNCDNDYTKDLELFPLVAQDMAITAKTGRAENDIDLSLGLGPSYTTHVSGLGACKSKMRLDSTIF